MGINYFTEDQLSALRTNPYVKNVSEKSITYTKEFREFFSIKYRDGQLPSKILIECGFDPKVLGKKRRNALVAMVKKCELRPDGFEDNRRNNSGCSTIKDLTDVEKIQRLEHQVKLLKQENEFLKKIEFLGRQAEWKAKRKQRQRKNSDAFRK